ncbi:MAG: hypothetical protein HQ595_03605, partial [Candidatus Omnitrophica bacterium]|nr:hypothetical protein [Candidatus Omnitrophota bacterium]
MNRKILAILLLGLFCLPRLEGVVEASEGKDEKPQVEYILISSSELEQVNITLGKGVSRLFPEAHQTYLEYNSAEAKKYIRKLKIQFVPFVIFEQSLKELHNFPALLKRKMIVASGKYYRLPDSQLRKNELMLLNRDKKPNRLDLFVRPFCPRSRKIQLRLINFIRQNKLDVEIIIRYLVEIDDKGISSFYGPIEVKESKRQAIIQQYHPDKFLEYLLLIQEKYTEAVLKDLAISLEDIDAKGEQAEKILRQDFQETVELGIERSPVFLWENAYLISSLGGLKRFAPFNQQKARVSGEYLLSGPIPIEFFYSGTCRSCQKIKEDYLPELEKQYKDKIVINYHDISDPDELGLKFAMEKEYAMLGGRVPQAYLPTTAFESASIIKMNLGPAIDEILAQRTKPSLRKIVPGANPILDKFSGFSPLIVLAAGLLDGINPCAFATLVFFVSLLSLSSYRKKEILYIGSAFIIAVFLTYFALGLGIFAALNKLQAVASLARLIYYLIAALALGLGVYSLSDLIQYVRSGFTKGCDLRFYNRLRTMLDNRRGLFIVIAIALFNGFIIALLESACTGQIYFPTIAYVIKMPVLRLRAFLYLGLYNLAFILPLVVIFIFAF